MKLNNDILNQNKDKLKIPILPFEVG